MSKVVLFSDFHAHMFEDFAKPDSEYGNDRFRDQINTLQKVFDIARENEATVVFAGDLFHSRKRLEDTVFNNVFKVFAKNEDIDTHLIRGNHDSQNNTLNTEHWLEAFKHLFNTHVFDKPERYVIGKDNDVVLNAIPYSDDVDTLKYYIESFSESINKNGESGFLEDAKNLLVAHIGVDGATTGKHSHRLEGAFSLDDLHPDVFDYVALGHYHKRQFLGNTNNTFYIGNTMQQNFSDEGQDKGVFLIDFDKGTEPEFIPINNKKFITLTDVDDNTQELVDNNYVRFVLPEEKAKEVEVFKEEDDNIRLEVQKEFNSDTRIEIGVDSSEEQIVKAYTEEYYPEVTDVALDVLKETMNHG